MRLTTRSYCIMKCIEIVWNCIYDPQPGAFHNALEWHKDIKQDPNKKPKLKNATLFHIISLKSTSPPFSNIQCSVLTIEP